MHPAYVREKARELRLERRLSIDQIAERMAVSRTTVFYWVRDLPLGRARLARRAPGQSRDAGQVSPASRTGLCAGERRDSRACDALPTFRDFVCMYIAEGYKRDRNRVALGNSDPRVVVLAARWITRFSRRPVVYAVQHHVDQRLELLASFLGLRAGRGGGGNRLSAQVEQRPAIGAHLAIPTRSPHGARMRHVASLPTRRPGWIAPARAGSRLATTGRSSVWSECSLWGRVAAGSNPAAPIDLCELASARVLHVHPPPV